MSDILSSVSNQVFSAYNTVATNSVGLANQAYNFGGTIAGRAVSFVTPALSGIVAKVQSFVQNLNAPTFFQNVWTVAKSNVGISALLLTGSVAALALSRRTDNQVHKYALLTAGVAALAFSAIAATTPFGSSPAVKVIVKA